MADLSDFKRRKIVGARMVAAIETKTANVWYFNMYCLKSNYCL